MSQAMLVSYGMRRIGKIELPNPTTFKITVELSEAMIWEKVIYALLVGDEIKRIGSSKGRLGNRLSSWNRDVTNALRGNKSATPLWEAAAWRDCLTEHDGRDVYARMVTTVTTPVGTFAAYMDEESMLINRHKPSLDRHTNR